MGSCISKCKPKKKFKDDCSHVHDKLVISQDPIIPSTNFMPPIIKEKRALSPAPSSSSTSSSLSSFSCSTNSKSTSISSSSSSSCSSSQHALTMKDRSFSNEFLWSCAKENSHIISQHPEKNVTNKIHPQNLEMSPIVVSTKVKHSIQEKPIINGSMPKKRARSNSPTIVRQKSYRKDQNSVPSIPYRGLRSPSPSRRFNGERNNRIFSMNGISDRRPIVYKANSVNSLQSGVKRDSFRPPSPSPKRDYSVKDGDSVKKKEVFTQQISKKIDEVGVGEIRFGQEMDTVMEDVNNPLIALDCFIFL